MKRNRLPVRFTGQHFTIDKVLIADAIEIAQLNKNDTVLDIGAGKGFLTVPLVRQCMDVVAIEKDNFLVEILRKKFAHNARVKIIAGDFRRYAIPLKNFKIVSNIPYGITADILKSLMFDHVEYFLGGALVLPLQVAKKLIAKKIFNPHIVFYQTFFDMKVTREIGPESFSPPPTIRSALVAIRKQNCRIYPESKQEYLNFLTYLLQTPRLSAKTALKKIFRKKQVRKLSTKYKLDPCAPIVSLSVYQWTGCFLEMTETVPEKYHPT